MPFGQAVLVSVAPTGRSGTHDKANDDDLRQSQLQPEGRRGMVNVVVPVDWHSPGMGASPITRGRDGKRGSV
jgi:hypothetical protein